MANFRAQWVKKLPRGYSKIVMDAGTVMLMYVRPGAVRLQTEGNEGNW